MSHSRLPCPTLPSILTSYGCSSGWASLGGSTTANCARPTASSSTDSNCVLANSTPSGPENWTGQHGWWGALGVMHGAHPNATNARWDRFAPASESLQTRRPDRDTRDLTLGGAGGAAAHRFSPYPVPLGDPRSSLSVAPVARRIPETPLESREMALRPVSGRQDLRPARYASQSGGVRYRKAI